MEKEKKFSGNNMSARKKSEHLLQNRMMTDRAIEENKCTCTHTVKGDMKLKPSKKYNQGSGQLIYICTECQKEVRIRNISDEEIDKAIDTLDDMIDIIKLSADMTKEGDAKIVKKLAKVQFRLRNEIKDLYKAAKSKNGGGKKKKNKGGNSDSEWEKPSAY